jgi:hypothetical protein
MSTPASAHPDLSLGQQLQTDGLKADTDYLRQTQSATLPYGGSSSFAPLWQDMGPFTTSLPPESQQMLAHAPGFDMNDPSYAMLMQGSEQYVNNAYYPWQNMHSGVKGLPVHPSAYQGMSATLAPDVLDKKPDSSPKRAGSNESTFAAAQTSGPTPSTDTLPSAGLDFHFSQDSKEPSFLAFSRDMPTGSGQITPAGEGFWDNFVMDNSWEDGTHETHHSAESNSGSTEVSAGGEGPG